MDWRERFKSEVRAAVGGRPVARLNASAGLPRNAIQNILDGHDPKLSRAIEVASALGFGFYLGPPGPAALRDIDRALNAESLNTESQPGKATQLIEGLSAILSKATDISQSKERERLGAELRKDMERNRELIELVKAGSRKHGDGEVLNPPLAAKIELSIDGPVFHEERCDWRIIEHMVPSSASREDLIWIKAADDSMEPEIRAGDPILVDRSQRVPLDNHLYLAICLNGIEIRRAVRIGPVLALCTDSAPNKEHPPEWLDPSAARLLGRVVRWGPEGGLHRRWWI